MIHKAMLPQLGIVRITFELPSCLWADRVAVVGDFNGWNPASTPMHQGRDGVWRASVDLPAGGRYHFRYTIDGQWQTDYHADGHTTNEYGSENSVVDTNLLDTESVRALAHGPLLREFDVQGARNVRNAQKHVARKAA